MNPTFHPLSESAILVEFGNVINRDVNDRVLSLFHALNDHPFYGFIESVPAYSSVAIYFDVFEIKKRWPGQLAAATVQQQLTEILNKSELREFPGRTINIPVCYDRSFGLDIEHIAASKHLQTDEVIRIHTSATYHIYMMGFLPGFAYMGEVDERIAMPRKKEPRLTVAPGSVGIAGKQTGIYPLQSPGGWQIVGRTPLKLFDPSNNEPVLLNAGDTVKFYQISKDEFEDHQAGNS